MALMQVMGLMLGEFVDEYTVKVGSAFLWLLLFCAAGCPGYMRSSPGPGLAAAAATCALLLLLAGSCFVASMLLLIALHAFSMLARAVSNLLLLPLCSQPVHVFAMPQSGTVLAAARPAWQATARKSCHALWLQVVDVFAMGRQCSLMLCRTLSIFACRWWTCLRCRRAARASAWRRWTLCFRQRCWTCSNKWAGEALLAPPCCYHVSDRRLPGCCC